MFCLIYNKVCVCVYFCFQLFVLHFQDASMLLWPPASPCPHRRWLKPCMESKFPLNYVVLLSCCLPSLCDSLHRIGASTTPICPHGLLNHWFLVCWYFAGKENPTSTTKQMLYLKQFAVPQSAVFFLSFLSKHVIFEWLQCVWTTTPGFVLSDNTFWSGWS